MCDSLQAQLPRVSQLWMVELEQMLHVSIQPELMAVLSINVSPGDRTLGPQRRGRTKILRSPRVWNFVLCHSCTPTSSPLPLSLSVSRQTGLRAGPFLFRESLNKVSEDRVKKKDTKTSCLQGKGSVTVLVCWQGFRGVYLPTGRNSRRALSGWRRTQS